MMVEERGGMMDGWGVEKEWTEKWRCTVSGYKHTKDSKFTGKDD